MTDKLDQIAEELWRKHASKDRHGYQDFMSEGAFYAALDEAFPVTERLEDFCDEIEQWAKAYPVDIFPEIDPGEWETIAVLLKNSGAPSLGRISASNMRHVITKVHEKVVAMRSAQKGDEAIKASGEDAMRALKIWAEAENLHSYHSHSGSTIPKVGEMMQEARKLRDAALAAHGRTG